MCAANTSGSEGSQNSAPHPNLGAIVELLGRAAGGATINAAEVDVELRDLGAATGLWNDTDEASRIWRELAEAAPDHAELAVRFRRAVEAENPLAAGIVDADMAPGLNGMIRNRWAAAWRRRGANADPGLRNIEWRTLSREEREELRAMLHQLEDWHRSFVRRGRVRKSALDTVVVGLADCYLRWIGSSQAPTSLSHSPRSRFVKFLHLAMQPFGMNFEVSPKALSWRWKRMRDRDLEALADTTD